MAGNKYKCDDCGLEAWMPRKRDCPACNGNMTRQARVTCHGKMRCLWCGGMFSPANGRVKTCSPECSRKKKLARQNEYSKARHRDGRTLAAKGKKGLTWDWLRRRVGDDGYLHRVKILHVLDQQTADGTFPYPDVLGYDGPMYMDNCPV